MRARCTPDFEPSAMILQTTSPERVSMPFVLGNIHSYLGLAVVARQLPLNQAEATASKCAKETLRHRRLYRQLQNIEKLPKRDQQALLRTIDAFLAKAS